MAAHARESFIHRTIHQATDDLTAPTRKLRHQHENKSGNVSQTDPKTMMQEITLLGYGLQTIVQAF